VLVDGGQDDAIILDAGTGMRQLGNDLKPLLAERGSPLHARLLLTHLHYDHLLGLPFFSPLEDPGALVEIFGPRAGERSLRELVDDVVKPPFFPVQMKEFGGEVRFVEVADEDFACGEAKVTARRITHTSDALGFRVELDGRSVAYLPDHQAPLDRSSVEDAALDLCRGVDLLIHDAQYDDEEFARRSDWGHSTVGYAVRVAAEAGAKALALFHHDPAHDDDRLVELESQARAMPTAAGMEIVAAREGMTIDLEPSER
jgi:phosphoribosyl 1,2-cyclic phosphodiesterase